MARSAKDLRDIINVSRLSVRDYSSDEFSTSESELNTGAEDDVEAIAHYISERPSSAIGTESSFQTFSETTRPGSAQGKRPHSAAYAKKTSHKSHRPETAPITLEERTVEETTCGRRTVPLSSKELPRFPSKFTPIPPIVKKKPPEEKQLDLSDLFNYLDGTIVSSWLEECNQTLDQIRTFINKHDNFVEFSNFFLTTLSECQYCELLDLEYSIIVDQLKFAFHAGITSENVSLKQLQHLVSVALKEYPKSLKRKTKGPKLLLDILIIFSSEKDDSYRKLLKNINYPSIHKQVVQWLLAVRAFGLISFVSGILRFYENIQAMKKTSVLKSANDLSASHLQKLNNWCIQSVCKNYVEVTEYLYSNQNVSVQDIYDDKQRNLIFLAASEGNIETLHFLAKLPVELDANQPSVNGNTPLHFVVSKGDIDTAKVLLDINGDPNMWNVESEGSTPLHTAVISGDIKMVMVLLEHGADTTVCMGVPATITPLSLAEELGYIDIAELLRSL